MCLFLAAGFLCSSFVGKVDFQQRSMHFVVNVLPPPFYREIPCSRNTCYNSVPCISHAFTRKCSSLEEEKLHLKPLLFNLRLTPFLDPENCLSQLKYLDDS